MNSYDELCCSANQFLDPYVYRIIQTAFPERFSLQELMDHTHDIHLLYPHAKEQPHMLGFVRLMHRDLWTSRDLLAKRHFLKAETKTMAKEGRQTPDF